MTDPIKLAAKGSKREKIEPPDLDCRIFSFLYRGVIFKDIDLTSFCEGFTSFIILGQVVKKFFRKILQISEMVFSWSSFRVSIRWILFFCGSLEKYFRNSLFLIM